jgi:hypothetical protein
MSHHDSVLSPQLNQRVSSSATADFFNKIDPERTLVISKTYFARCMRPAAVLTIQEAGPSAQYSQGRADLALVVAAR